MIRTILNVLLKRPILVIYDVTKLCNQRCLMCNIWKNQSCDMDIEELEEEIKKLGLPLISDMFNHAGVRPYVEKGYEVLVF